MGDGLDIKVTILSKPVMDALTRMASRTSSGGLGLFMRDQVHPLMVKRIKDRFSTEGDLAVGKWAELTYATSRIREWKGYGAFHPINKRTGAMEDFLTSSFMLTTQGGAGARLKIPGSTGGAEMAKKIATAQGGGSGQSSRMSGPNRNTPARPVLALDAIDAVVIGKALFEWVIMGGF